MKITTANMVVRFIVCFLADFLTYRGSLCKGEDIITLALWSLIVSKNGPPIFGHNYTQFWIIFRQETDKTVIYLKIYGPTTQFRHKRNFNLLASKYLTFAFFLRRFSMGTVQQMVLKRSADRFVNEG